MTSRMLAMAALCAPLALAVGATDFVWTGADGDGKWTNPNNWSARAGYPQATNDNARFDANASVVLDTGRVTGIGSLAVRKGRVTISGTPGSALRTLAVPAGAGKDGLVVGSSGAVSDQTSLVLEVPLDGGTARMDKWLGGSLVLRNGLVSAMRDGNGYAFIFGSGRNALEGGATVLFPEAALGLGNGAPNRADSPSTLRIADAARVDVRELRLSVRVNAKEHVEVTQSGARSDVWVRGLLAIGLNGTPGLGNVYRLEDGLLKAGDVRLGDPSSDRFVLAGGTFLATQDMTLPAETVFEGEPKIGAAENCRLTLAKWPDGAKRLLIAGEGEVVLARGFERKGEIAVTGGKVVDRTSEIVDAGDRLQVFWDDHLVDTAHTTARRQVHQPEYAGVVMMHDKPWEGDGCDFHNILEDRDGKGLLYRMYYLGFAMGTALPEKIRIPASGIRVCYAESRDGLSWTKPELGLVTFQGSKRNNILLDVNHFGYGWDNFMVFKDGNPKCPADERYKAIAMCQGKEDAEGFGNGLCCFLSADGLRWRKGWRLTNVGDFDSLNVAFWDAVRNEYHCYYRRHHYLPKPDRHGNTFIRDIRHIVSKDFRQWTSQKPIAFDAGAEDYALYTSVLQPYTRAPELYVGFPSRYVERKQWTDTFDRLPGVDNRRNRWKKSPRYGLTVTDCVFMMTRDGLNFHREEDAFMEPGPENPLNWVYGDCYPARGLVLTPGRRPGSDEELSFYSFEGHWNGEPESLLRHVLRQDGFVSRRAPYAGAKLVTRPFTFDGDELLINFKTSARGGLYVTLRDAVGGASIRSAEIIGNKVDRVVGFEKGAVADFRGRAVVLEFDMRDADVYAFRFRKSSRAAVASAAPLTPDFAEPPRTCRPGLWFHLVGGNVSRPGLTADLEAIRAAGIPSITLFHEQVGDETPWPGVPEQIPCLSPKWKDLVGFIADECGRLGIDFRMQNCPGWSTSGGPWIAASNAMRIVVSSRKDVMGGGPVGVLPLPAEATDLPDRDYRDIAAVAFPTPAGDDDVELTPVSVTTNGWTFTYDFARPVDIRTLVFPAPATFSWRHAFDTGVKLTFAALDPVRESAAVRVPRGTWMDDSSLSVACAPLRARRWRLTVEHPYPMGRFSVRFLSAQRLENWEGAAGLGFRGVIRRDYPAQAPEGWIAEGTVRTLSGRPEETLPPGNWTVLRVGHVNARRVNHPAPKVATGWECSKLDRSGIEAHFAVFTGELMRGPLADGRLKGVFIDSWECMRQTWGNCLAEEFARKSSFDLRSWMPALFGYVIGSPARTREFLRDWTGVRGRLVEENYYRRFAELAHEHGLEAVYETSFGDVVAGDLMRYWKWSDAPMCEYWQPHTGEFVGGFDDKPVRPCVSAAHLYGKRRAAAEALTSFDLTFDENFRLFKRVIDLHFARGITYPVFQAYTHKPEVGGKGPGSSLGARIGTPFLREQTWWPYMKELADYSARCTLLLEKGLPVVDVLRYLGDDFDHRPVEPETLTGVEAQFKTDYLNGDVLETRLSVADGRFVLPDGMRYSVLWLPDGVFVTEGHRRRIAELERLGGRVVRGDLAAGLRRQVLAADVCAEGDLDWYHRRDGARDIWFLAALTNGFVGKVSFRVEGGARHVIPLELAPSQSLFVVREGETWTLLDPVTGGVFERPSATGAPQALANWDIAFPTRTLTNVTLKAWKDLPGTDEERAFSGTASYFAAFEAKNDAHLTLDLGRVRDFAEVYVNGKSVRKLWCEPYRCTLDGFLKSGRNELRIDVTSTWFNRLAADAAKPEGQRQTWTLFGPKSHTPLRDSGLLGPISVR